LPYKRKSFFSSSDNVYGKKVESVCHHASDVMPKDDGETRLGRLNSMCTYTYIDFVAPGWEHGGEIKKGIDPSLEVSRKAWT